MSKIFSAPFAQTPRTTTAVCTTATTIVDDNPSNAVALLTAGADGAIVTEISVMPRSTATATALYLFLSKASDNYATKRLISSRVMPAITLSVANAVSVTVFDYTELTPLRLEAGDKLHVGIGVALTQGIVFKAEFTDY